jgi:hypothetical protein
VLASRFSASSTPTTRTIGSFSDNPGPEYPLKTNLEDSTTAVSLESDSNNAELVGADRPSILQRWFFTDKAVRGGVTNFGKVRLMNGLFA